ncbi:MAG: sugar phosphate isomerase/epimerase, partial [Bacteroidota bacterium]
SEVRSIVKDLDLKVNSAHMDAGAFFDPNQPDYFKQHLEEVVKAGQAFAVIGWVPEEHREKYDDYKRAVDLANEAGELAKKANVQLAYHNHNFEFKPFEKGTPYDLLLSKTEPDLLHFELDVFWCDLAGLDPVPLMEKIGDRLALLHLKDKNKGVKDRYEGSEVSDFKEVGNGVLDFPAILKTAQALGVSHCLVEQDESPDPLASLGMSMEYLNQI